MMHIWRLTRTSGLSREEWPRKTKIGTEVAYVTRDSDTTFKVKRSKVNLQGAGHVVAASRTACLLYFFPYQFPETGNQAMWLVPISEKVKQSDKFVFVNN